jgi:hypothetical protein
MSTVKLDPEKYPHKYKSVVIDKYTGEGHFQILEEQKDKKVEYLETHYLVDCENKT